MTLFILLLAPRSSKLGLDHRLCPHSLLLSVRAQEGPRFTPEPLASRSVLFRRRGRRTGTRGTCHAGWRAVPAPVKARYAPGVTTVNAARRPCCSGFSQAVVLRLVSSSPNVSASGSEAGVRHLQPFWVQHHLLRPRAAPLAPVFSVPLSSGLLLPVENRPSRVRARLCGRTSAPPCAPKRLPRSAA